MRFNPWRMGAVLVAPLLLVACDRATKTASLEKAPMEARLMQADARAGAGAAQQAPAEQAVRRYIALRHELHIYTAPDAVEAAWKAAADACSAAGCELLGSTISHDDERRPANAMLEARVPPAALDAFLAKVSALGAVGQHNTSSEDKTAEVIDVEARQKNMVEFRDKLRQMLATPNAKLHDMIEVERELTRVQSELDSLASRRKVLANQTEKVHVKLFFSTRPSMLEAETWAPVKRAVMSAGHVLAGSVAALIDFVVAVVPWLLLLWVAVKGLRALWRRRRRAA
jgi:hypothetical protein